MDAYKIQNRGQIYVIMANQVILSQKFTLQARDFLKGAMLAVISAVAPLLQATLNAGELTFNWKAIGVTALGTFIAYIIKKFAIDPPTVVTTYTTNDKAAQVAQEIKK